jgi:hypothetical protein
MHRSCLVPIKINAYVACPFAHKAGAEAGVLIAVLAAAWSFHSPTPRPSSSMPWSYETKLGRLDSDIGPPNRVAAISPTSVCLRFAEMLASEVDLA